MTDTIIQTTVEQEQTPFELYMNGPQDFLIPVVFPDYEIHTVDKETVQLGGFDVFNIHVPEIAKFDTPAIKTPYLGHAGVLIINGKSGLSYYYEYGRYPGPEPAGNVRKISIPDVNIKAGMISAVSLKNTLRKISSRSGQSGRVSGVVLRGTFFKKASDWLHKKQEENNSPTKIEYDLFDHNCMTFVIDLVDYLGLDSSWRPPVVVPSAYIEQFQLSQIDLDYSYSTNILEVNE